MAGWNGSGQRGISALVQPKAKEKKPSPWRGLIAGACVVALAMCAYFAFFSDDKTPVESEKGMRPSKIAETKPAPAPKVEEKEENVLKPRKRKKVERKFTNDRNARVAPPMPNTNSLVVSYGMVKGKPIFKRRIFKHNSENLIAAVIGTQLGTRIIDIPFDERMVEDFKESLKEDIKIEEGDTPEEIEMKQTMVDAKAEIVERMKNGESLPDIINESRNEINKLARYSEDLQSIYHQMCEGAKSIEECEEYRKRANEMLKERGLPEIRAHRRGKYAVPEEKRYDYKKPVAAEGDAAARTE